MTDNFRLNFGVSLSVLAFSCFEPSQSLAQTCTVPPTCESMGYNKTASQCGNLATLKCPFDQTKLFCTAFTDSEGNTPIAVGDYAYSDGTFSAALKPGKTPIGVIFNTSGLAVALDNYTNVGYGSYSDTKCSEYTSGSLSLWKNPTQEHLSSMYSNKTQIDNALSAVSATPLGSSKLAYGLTSIYIKYINFSNGNNLNANSSTENYPLRCIIDITSITATPVIPTKTYNVGDTYVKDGIAQGLVTSITDNGIHGTVTSVATIIGTQSEISVSCSNKTSGNLNWGIASGKDVQTKLHKEGYDSCGYFWTSTGCNHICPNISSSSSTSASNCSESSGFCSAPF